jgi:hypothetical protein
MGTSQRCLRAENTDSITRACLYLKGWIPAMATPKKRPCEREAKYTHAGRRLSTYEIHTYTANVFRTREESQPTGGLDEAEMVCCAASSISSPETQ